MEIYTDYTNINREQVKDMKPGYAIISTYPDYETDEDTVLHCKILEVNTSGRLNLIVADVNGKLAIMYYNDIFKNLFAQFGVGYCKSFRTGEWFEEEDTVLYKENGEEDTETMNRWTDLVKSYGRKLYYGYCGDNDIRG